MASSPIISWQIEGEKMEAVADFLFLDSKLSVDGDCSHESRKTIASWKENDDKPRRCVEKQRHHCWQKVSIVKGLVFPVVTYFCEN